MTRTDPIQLTPEEAKRLRDVLIAERQAREALDIETLKYRVALLQATSDRARVFDELADTYTFDSSNPYDFDWVHATLVPKQQG